MALSPRNLLTRSAIGSDVVAVGDLGALFSSRPAFSHGGARAAELVPDPAGVLDLPPGFTYTVVGRAGDPLSGGGVTPGRHEGAGAFRGPHEGVRLVQNHGIGPADPHPVLADPARTYDAKAGGCTTTLTLDHRMRPMDERVSLAGTWANCAGGVTPWGTWLTCEHTEQKAGPSADEDHGFVFEVDPAHSSNNVEPTPLRGLGRFAHAAVCVDPQRGDVYLTEDAGGPNGLLYRFRPLEQHGSYGSLRNGGFLQAMRCRKGTTHVPDLSVFDVPGTTLAVEWVPVPDPSAGSTPIRQQYADGEVTRSATCEGAWRGSRRIDDEAGHPMWHGGRDDRVHFACSFARRNDGSLVAHDGQVWAYDPDDQSLTLEVHLGVDQDRTRAGFEGPDRVTLSPHGGLILVEHGGAQHLLAADEDGSTSLFGRYRLPTSRLAGPTFSPDGSALFATIEDHGLTIAIRGPFRALARP